MSILLWVNLVSKSGMVAGCSTQFSIGVGFVGNPIEEVWRQRLIWSKAFNQLEMLHLIAWLFAPHQDPIIYHPLGDYSQCWYEWQVTWRECCTGEMFWQLHLGWGWGEHFFPNTKQMMSCYSYSYSYWPMKWVSWMLDVHTQKEAKPSWLWHSEQCSGRQNYFCIPSPKLVPRVDSSSIYCRGRVTTRHCHNWHTNIPTMMSLFSLQRHGFDGRTYLTPGSLCRRGRTRLPSKWFSRINKIKEKILCQMTNSW